MELLTQVSHREMNDAITYLQTFLEEREGLWNFGHTSDKLGLSVSILHFLMFPSAERVNRTDNAIERYKRRLNENFSNAHPNLYAFMEVIKQKFEYYQARCTEIRQNASGIIFMHPQNTQNKHLANFRSFINRGNNSNLMLFFEFAYMCLWTE
ncbi:LOW QUALITY PROTEIN: hypothetical protein HZS_7641 [Henneguya salminicola]|nr:LOW QUALITY PROTEIN: hypothetical protein HZS_7641 [Henneguya salminicola]